MFIVFNKEYRKFEAIMSDLMNKMKKSARIVRKDEENAEVYELDTVDIIFKIDGCIIVVKDKSGVQIVSLDCHYDSHDKLQNAKWNQFGGFLSVVRNAYKKYVEKAEKLQKVAQEAQKKAEAKQKIQDAEAAKQKILTDALERLRGL